MKPLYREGFAKFLEASQSLQRLCVHIHTYAHLGIFTTDMAGILQKKT